MLGLKFIEENPDIVKKAIKNKGESSDINRFLELRKEWRKTLQEMEDMKHQRNVTSEKIAKLKKKKEDASKWIAKAKTISEEAKGHEQKLKVIEEEIWDIVLAIPNIPHPDVPIGKTPEENVEIKQWGNSIEVDFEMKPHWELAENLDIIDFERGGKVTGTGFPFYKGAGAKLERALINFFLDYHTTHHDYTEFFPPIMINADSAHGTGQLPDKEDLMYTIEKDELYMIPTSEVPVTNLHRDEVLLEEDLPIYYCAYTPNFRREAGSYGKDVRGLNRVHQFNKVELVKFVQPPVSYDEHEKLLAEAEKILQMLEIPYRVLLMCTGDLGFTQAKKYDLEVWSAGQQRWLEVSSISNFEDFQARRANVRFRPSGGGRPQFVHTLNGSGLATPRTFAAILENNQNDDGSIMVPDVLVDYVGTNVIR